MLNKQLLQYIDKYSNNEQVIFLGNEVIEFINQHQLSLNDVKVQVSEHHFHDLYMERCDKETDQFIKEEHSEFLNEPLHYLKEHTKEFLYVEFRELELIGVDGITLELDDIFKKYNVMIGLKLQKKFEQEIKTFLNSTLSGDDLKFALMWNQQEGLWELNILLQGIKGVTEELTIEETLQKLYAYLFALCASVEEGRNK